MIEYIKEQLSQEELLAQLAEEATELAHAALKLRRAIDGTNPTPVAREKALENLVEEIADIYLVLKTLDLTDMWVIRECEQFMKGKTARWTERLKAMRQEDRRWIPVTERLPDRNKPVLVRCTNTTISGGYVTHIGSCDSGKFWFLRTQPGISSFPIFEWQVTHWMELPEPPKEVNHGQAKG